MDWHECEGCETEFRIVSDSDKVIEYCPFCSHPIEVSERLSEEDEY